PASYRFARTDDYLSALVPLTRRVVYRLGTSIEHTRRKHHVHPPPSPQLFAEVCVRIVMHLNEGWADGLHLGIGDFEIWNEPDLGPAMWTGTLQDYLELYDVTARALKEHDASLRVGGPGLAHPGGELHVA